MSEELKPCPFCGSKDIVLESFGELRHTACCSTCECNTGYMQDDCEAIESWNTRSLEDDLRKQLDIVVEALKAQLIFKERNPFVSQGDFDHLYEIACNSLAEINRLSDTSETK
jgi:Lar family restriction alleviation protein